MKYYVLLPRSSLIGGEIDIQQWMLILRAASAHRSYGHVYHDLFKAHNIADFLILRPEMPRSLVYCARFVQQNLDMLAKIYDRRESCHDAMDDLIRMVEDTSMDEIFAHGLHEFLNDFIDRNNRVADSLSVSYNFY